MVQDTAVMEDGVLAAILHDRAPLTPLAALAKLCGRSFAKINYRQNNAI